MTSNVVPYVDLQAQHAPLREELLEAIGGVIDSGKFVLGPTVEEFEAEFAALCGTKHAIGVASGTDAIVLALRALEIGAGDEVITTPNSFVSTASAIALVGARPVFVDVREDYNLDPARISAALTPRTRAVLPVHLTGRPAAMNDICTFASDHGLAVIEDCAQAVLAALDGRRVGSLGDIGCFSLHPLKTLGAIGDAGVLTTDDDEVAAQLRVLRNIGQASRGDAVAWSANSRLDSVQAAVLLVKLRYTAGWTEARRRHAEAYRSELADVEGIRTPEDGQGEYSVYHTFVVQAERRDELRDHLADCGIGTAIHYPVPIHLQTIGRSLGYRSGDFPRAEEQARRIVSLPVYPELTEAQRRRVSDEIRRFSINRHRRDAVAS